MNYRSFRISFSLLAMSVVVVAGLGAASQSAADEVSEATGASDAISHANPADSTSGASAVDEAAAEVPRTARPTKTVSAEAGLRADAFIAGPDWEFDGFVSGGQDSAVRSMFYLNDLLYLNIGAQSGIATGDRLEIFKRGDKVRDPQNGRFLGYEVRRAAVVRATDRIEDEACAVRIIRTHEPVEIGDLVRRVH